MIKFTFACKWTSDDSAKDDRQRSTSIVKNNYLK